MFDVWDRQPRDPEHLIDEVERIVPLVSAFQGLAADERDDLEYQLSMLDDFDEDDGPDPPLAERARLERLIAEIADPDDGWKALVRRDGKRGHRSVLGVHRALARGADRLERVRLVPARLARPGQGARVLPAHGRGVLRRARRRDRRGRCPGSSYFAAELRNEIADANAEAARLGLPFRFRAEGVQS